MRLSPQYLCETRLQSTGDGVSLGEEIKPGRWQEHYRCIRPRIPNPKFSLGHFKHSTTPLRMFFQLLTVPSSILGLGLLNQPTLALFALPAKP